MRLHASKRSHRWLRFGKLTLLPAVLVLLVVLSRDIWWPWVGEWLVSPDTPAPADLIVVLGGDFWGHRVVEAANLAVRGYAPHVLISGPDYYLNGTPHPEGELATKFLVDKGYPPNLFWTFPHHAPDTLDEAKLLSAELKRLKANRLLIVTSNYHSRRSSILFHALLPFSEIRVIGVPEDYFEPKFWWKTQSSRELVRSEWMKIIGTVAISWLLRLQAALATLSCVMVPAIERSYRLMVRFPGP